MADTYFEYIFGEARNVFDILMDGYGHYSPMQYMHLLNKAKKEYDALKEENEMLKREIATINVNIVASLERDLLHMRKQVHQVNKPKYNIARTVEQLDP
jgi:hypothetical protein